jgi:hypothetical protein
MRVDYQPVVPPHECALPPAEDYPAKTLITCEGITARRFDGQSMRPIRCGIQWSRGVTAWRHRPRWIRAGRTW